MPVCGSGGVVCSWFLLIRGNSVPVVRQKLHLSSCADCRDRLYHGCEEVSGSFVVTCGDTAEVLELIEEALDEVALPVERVIDGALDLAVAAGRDMGAATATFDQINYGASVVAAIGNEVALRLEPFEQDRCDGFVR